MECRSPDPVVLAASSPSAERRPSFRPPPRATSESLSPVLVTASGLCVVVAPAARPSASPLRARSSHSSVVRSPSTRPAPLTVPITSPGRQVALPPPTNRKSPPQPPSLAAAHQRAPSQPSNSVRVDTVMWSPPTAAPEERPTLGSQGTDGSTTRRLMMPEHEIEQSITLDQCPSKGPRRTLASLGWL